ncbi:hypothetical protein [Agromyces bauzanensis]
MSYQSTLTEIRDSSNRDVQAAWARYESGQITEGQLVQLVAAVIVLANVHAVAVADVALSAELTVKTGRVWPAAATALDRAEQARLEKGVKTLLRDEKAGATVYDRLERLARSEPLTAATNAYSRGVSQSKAVTGWVRQMDGDPCQLCRWWWREGRVWPKDHPMQHHKGCECTQRVVTIPSTKEVSS